MPDVGGLRTLRHQRAAMQLERVNHHQIVAQSKILHRQSGGIDQAAVARRHEGVIVGPLVARIGLVGTPHLVEQYRTLERVAPSRVICALGSGDKLSAAENEAYDVPVRSADERRALMAETARQLSDTMPIWFGAGNDETNRVAREVGATINLWDASPQRLRDISKAGAVSWAGPAPTELAGTLDAVCDAGATWAVFAPDVDVEALRQWRESNDD